MIGMVQATEAIKRLTGVGEPLIGRLLTYDALGMRFREVKLRRDPNCPLCGTSPTIKDLSIHGETGGACEVTTTNARAAVATGSRRAILPARSSAPARHRRPPGHRRCRAAAAPDVALLHRDPRP